MPNFVWRHHGVSWYMVVNAIKCCETQLILKHYIDNFNENSHFPLQFYNITDSSLEWNVLKSNYVCIRLYQYRYIFVLYIYLHRHGYQIEFLVGKKLKLKRKILKCCVSNACCMHSNKVYTTYKCTIYDNQPILLKKELLNAGLFQI